MPKKLEALCKLQSLEHQLAVIRGRLRAKNAAVEAQERRLEELRAEYQTRHEEHLARQKEIASVELELRSREEEVSRLRLALNTAKTNKEYASILTRINTIKADSSKLEDEALRFMQTGEDAQKRAREIAGHIAQAEQYLEQLKQTSAEEIANLQAMLRDLQTKRQAAAGEVPGAELSVFNRIAATRDGDAMARIEVVGDKPPHEYVCGGCNMAISAEHANALRTRDEIRFCDCCGRILYLDEAASRQEQQA